MEPGWVLLNVWVLVRFKRLEYKRCVQVAVKRMLSFFELYFPLLCLACSPAMPCWQEVHSQKVHHQFALAVLKHAVLCWHLRAYQQFSQASTPIWAMAYLQYFQTSMVPPFSGTIKAVLMHFLPLFWSNCTVIFLLCFCSIIQLCIPKCNIWKLHLAYTNNMFFLYTCCRTPL